MGKSLNTLQTSNMLSLACIALIGAVSAAPQLYPAYPGYQHYGYPYPVAAYPAAVYPGAVYAPDVASTRGIVNFGAFMTARGTFEESNGNTVRGYQIPALPERRRGDDQHQVPGRTRRRLHSH